MIIAEGCFWFAEAFPVVRLTKCKSYGDSFASPSSPKIPAINSKHSACYRCEVLHAKIYVYSLVQIKSLTGLGSIEQFDGDDGINV